MGIDLLVQRTEYYVVCTSSTYVLALELRSSYKSDQSDQSDRAKQYRWRGCGLLERAPYRKRYIPVRSTEDSNW